MAGQRRRVARIPIPRRRDGSTLCWLSRTLFAIAAVLDTGCGPTDPGPQLAPIPNTAPTLSIEVGTGASDYVSLADGDPVDLIFGTQGGWHVWTGVKVRDKTVQDARINLYARFEDGLLAGDPSAVAARLDPATDGSRTHASMRNFIRDGNQTRGRRLILRVEVITSDGRHGAGERLVVAR